VAHRDSVVDGDRIELCGEATLFGDPLLDLLADFMQVDVSRDELRERIDDRNDRTAHLLVPHAVRPPKTAGPGHAAAPGGYIASEWFHVVWFGSFFTK